METVYLLGAGASCESLPVVSNFQERISIFRQSLIGIVERAVVKRHPEIAGGYPDKYRLPPRGDYLENLSEALAHMETIASQHASVDTYARKLFLQKDHKGLLALKTELVAYFLLAQSLTRPDKRYDHFFASLLLEDAPFRPRFPKEVGILTWNYDAQLEMAYYDYCHNIDSVMEEITQNKNIYRLNGFCGHTKKGEDIWIQAMLESFSLKFAEGIDAILQKNKSTDPAFITGKKEEPSIRFAWEERDVDDKARAILESCKTLVVIGYSFPTFNQRVGRELVKAAKQLERIYIQAPESDHETLLERINTIVSGIPRGGTFVPIEIKPLKATDLFYIPNNLIMT